jgi:hypothetical protein
LFSVVNFFNSYTLIIRLKFKYVSLVNFAIYYVNCILTNRILLIKFYLINDVFDAKYTTCL